MMHEEEPRDTFEPAKDKVDNMAEEISCPSPNQVTPQEDSPLYPSVDNTFVKASPNKDTMKVDTVIRDSLGKTNSGDEDEDTQWCCTLPVQVAPD